jgi:hypothetical protein
MVLILVKNKKENGCVEEQAIRFEDVSLHFLDKRGNTRIFYFLSFRDDASKTDFSVSFKYYLHYAVT